jgi:hypothetical protein
VAPIERTGKRFLSARPLQKAQKRLKGKINALLPRGNPTPWPELLTRLNRLLSGWAEYFSFGHTDQADEAVGWHVREWVRRFLCRRHKVRVSGTSRFGYAEIHETVGVVNRHQTRLPSCEACSRAGCGNPQVRFDERRWETELRPRLRHRHQCESRRQHQLPRPKATVPTVDSTYFSMLAPVGGKPCLSRFL